MNRPGTGETWIDLEKLEYTIIQWNRLETTGIQDNRLGDIQLDLKGSEYKIIIIYYEQTGIYLETLNVEQLHNTTLDYIRLY